MVSDDVEGYSLFKVGEVIFSGIILVILLSFIYSSTTGEGLRQTQEAIDISVFLSSLDGIDYVEVEKQIGIDAKVIIKDGFVKVGESKRNFDSDIKVDFNQELEKGDILKFVKEGSELEVSVNV